MVSEFSKSKINLRWVFYPVSLSCLLKESLLVIFLSISFQLDIEECRGSNNVCDDNAYCSNTVGFYNCTCKEGFTGDGHSCSGKKKTFNLILIPTETYRMWLYYGIFHLVELDIFFFDIFFVFDITVACIYRYGWVQQCNPCACDIIANYTKTKVIHSYTYCFSYLIFHIRKKSSLPYKFYQRAHIK